jgi:hypothetical protein
MGDGLAAARIDDVRVVPATTFEVLAVVTRRGDAGVTQCQHGGFQGRIARGITGSILLIIGIILADETLWASIPLVVIGLFCMFEAVRGWCFLRACGVRTKL